MKCSNCGKEIPNDSIFCEACGARMKKSRKALWITLSIVFVLVAGVVLFFMQSKQPTYYEEHSYYVDLGLPSGTLWKNTNEGGDCALYTYDEAINMFGNQLPTKYQLEELQNKCTWSWTGDGYKVIGPNGNSITLPAAGYRECDGDVCLVGSYGYYWSSTPYDSDYAWYLDFLSSAVGMHYHDRCLRLSVRLVQ